MRLSGPFGVSTINSFGLEVLKAWKIQELMVDSTFITIKEKLELFAVLVSWMEMGVLITFFKVMSMVSPPLLESMCLFLQGLYIEVPHLRPKFFFTHKDRCQICAINTA